MDENDQAKIEDQVIPDAEVIQPEPEKMLTQSEVNKLMGQVRVETRNQTYNKARKEIMSELQQQVQPAPQEQAQERPQSNNMGGMPQMSLDQVRQMISEETSKHTQAQTEKQQQDAHRAQMSKLAASFIQKMDAGKSKYPDFENQIAALNLPSIPEIVHLAEGVDNTADVMWEFKENPHKIGHLLSLYARNPALAQQSMNQLSASIKHNDAAKNMSMPGDPLQPIQGSQTGSSMDGGSNVSVSDLQKYFSKRR